MGWQRHDSSKPYKKQETPKLNCLYSLPESRTTSRCKEKNLLQIIHQSTVMVFKIQAPSWIIWRCPSAAPSTLGLRCTRNIAGLALLYFGRSLRKPLTDLVVKTCFMRVESALYNPQLVDGVSRTPWWCVRILQSLLWNSYTQRKNVKSIWYRF